MRIVSRTRDYYDGVSPGDTEPLYVREERTIRLEPGDPRIVPVWGLPLVDWELRPPHELRELEFRILAFCGRHYFHLTDGRRIWWSTRAVLDDLVDGYRLADVHESTARQQSRAARAMLDLKQDTPRHARAWSRAWLAWRTEGRPGDAELHRLLAAPVVLVGRRAVHWSGQRVLEDAVEVTLDPCLRALGFQSVVDPYTAWQELDMFLGGEMATQQDPVPERTQDLIRDAHGFDDASFKQRSPGKKARRRANKRRKKSE